jgi:3-oxoacyl-[acyl-carrier protein] reductase
MLLKDKIAVIYGAGSSIGSAVSRAFARDGTIANLTCGSIMD